MKIYSIVLMIVFLLVITANSCRERKPGDPKVNTQLQEVEEKKQESMEKFEEWAGSDEESADSTAVHQDSTNMDSTNLKE